MKRSSAILILLLFVGQAIFAQNIRAVLVQLSTEQNRIQYFNKAGKTNDAERVELETKKIQAVTIKDFTDHFSGCPVYYFIDTNQNAIKNGEYDNLLDADGHAVSSDVAGKIGNHFAVVYYGFPNADATVSAEQKGLVVLDNQFNQVFFIVHKVFATDDNAYNYSSKKYDLEYIASAERLSKRIGKGFKKAANKQD